MSHFLSNHDLNCFPYETANGEAIFKAALAHIGADLILDSSLQKNSDFQIMQIMEQILIIWYQMNPKSAFFSLTDPYRAQEGTPKLGV